MSNNDLELAINQLIGNQMAGIHTAMPAVITKFDASTCLASVSPQIKYYVADGRQVDMPLIDNIPVFMPRAGNTQITYPVKEGDNCLVVFCERSIDEWIGAENTDNHDPRKFSLSDGFVFVGMCPSQSIDAENVEIINNGSIVSVTPNNLINITGNVTIKGNVNIEGNLGINGVTTSAGDVRGGGISLMFHKHMGKHGMTSTSM